MSISSLSYQFCLQILEDPSPSPSKRDFSPEFCSFVDACLQKNAEARPTAEQVKLEWVVDVDSFPAFPVFHFPLEKINFGGPG